jgi:hypothetical protein
LRLASAQDVPAGDAGAALAAPAAASDRPRRLTAILGIARRDGDWATSPGSALVVAGYARLDLRDTDLAGRELRIRATAVFGVVSITVPPDTEVAESGVAVVGLRLGRAGAPAGPAGRQLVVSGLSVFGVVRVRRRPPAPRQVPGQPPPIPASAVVAAAGDKSPPADRATAETGRF